MRPIGSKPPAIAQLPTPHEVRHCQDGQFYTQWNVTEGKAHITLPDLTLGYRVEAVTLSGIHTMEVNRFDAASRFLGWGPQCSPNISQKRLMCKYFGHIMQNWRDDIGIPRPIAVQLQPQIPPNMQAGRSAPPASAYLMGFVYPTNQAPPMGPQVSTNHRMTAGLNCSNPQVLGPATNEMTHQTPHGIVGPQMEPCLPRAPPPSPIEISPIEEPAPQVSRPLTPIPTASTNTILRNHVITKLAPIQEKSLSMTLKRKMEEGVAPSLEQWKVQSHTTKRSVRYTRKQSGPTKLTVEPDQSKIA